MYSIDYLYQIFGGFENFLYFCAPKRRGARVVEEARLESVYTPKRVSGVRIPVSPLERIAKRRNPCKLILYRDFFLAHSKINIKDMGQRNNLRDFIFKHII